MVVEGKVIGVIPQGNHNGDDHYTRIAQHQQQYPNNPNNNMFPSPSAPPMAMNHDAGVACYVPPVVHQGGSHLYKQPQSQKYGNHADINYNVHAVPLASSQVHYQQLSVPIQNQAAVVPLPVPAPAPIVVQGTEVNLQPVQIEGPRTQQNNYHNCHNSSVGGNAYGAGSQNFHRQVPPVDLRNQSQRQHHQNSQKKGDDCDGCGEFMASVCWCCSMIAIMPLCCLFEDMR